MADSQAVTAARLPDTQDPVGIDDWTLLAFKGPHARGDHADGSTKLLSWCRMQPMKAIEELPNFRALKFRALSHLATNLITL